MKEIFLSLLSRYDIYKKAFTPDEMLNHYYCLVNFWMNKIKSIDAVFSVDVPHVPSSFSLYLVTKFLKIPFIYKEAHLIYNRYEFLGCSFKHRSLLIQNEQKTAEELYSAHSDFYNNYHSSINGVVHKFTSYLDTRIEAKWWRMLGEDINSSLPISIKSIFSRRFNLRDLYTNELAWKVSRRSWDQPKSGIFKTFSLFCKNSGKDKNIFCKKKI